MDQVKQYLELIRKHHFWFLCVLAVLIGLVVWKTSTSKLKTQFDAKSQEITAKLNSLQTILNDQSQSHSDWSAGVEKQTAAVGQDVRKAWDDLYKQQKEKIFAWPQKLRADFIAAINAHGASKDELPGRLRDRYLNTVKSFVAELPAIVDSAPLDDNAFAGGGGSPFGAAMVAAAPVNAGDHLVAWDSQSLGSIAKSFDWQLRPSTLLVKYAQEELWVYKALCNVIKSVNEGSTSNADAPVKVIQEMKIAYTAVEPAFGGAGQKRIYPLVPADNAAAQAPSNDKAQAPDPGSRLRSDSDRNSLFGGGAADAGDNGDDKWKKFRYVNAKGEPLMAADVDSPAPENKQYNMMPFDLVLTVDNRYIDRLLVAFRNSILPMEVQQVRINPQASTNAMSNLMSHSIVASAATPSQERTATVEIRGVVYLIKPVDQEQFPATPAGDSATPDATQPGGAPTATATPAPAPNS